MRHHNHHHNEPQKRTVKNNFISLMRLLFLFLTGLPQEGYANSLPAWLTLPDFHTEGVNLLTGTYSNEVIDLATEGVDPLVLRRHFNSEHPENGWEYSLSKHLYLKLDDHNNYIIHYPDGEGGTVLFSSTVKVDYNKKKDRYSYPQSATFFYNTSNDHAPHLPCYPSHLSGQHRLDNVRIELTEKGHVITAYHGDGTVRRFLPLKETTETHPKRLSYNLEDKLPLPLTYELEKETLPSGNKRLFWCLKEESRQLGRLKLETLSPTGKFLNHIVMDNLHQQDSRAITHEDALVNYQRHGIAISQPNTLGNHFFKYVTGPDGIRHHYNYDNKGRLLSKELPNDRMISISYLDGGKEVAELKAPIPGNLQHGQYTSSHRFLRINRQDKVHEMLVAPEGRTSTRVLASNGKLLQYTRNIRAQKQCWWQNGEEKNPHNDRAYSVQKFFWGNQEKREDLLTIAFFSNQDTSTAIGCRTFTYDTSHNVTEERLYGNLTGTCTNFPTVNDKGSVLQGGGESTWTRHSYSNDGRNLLLATQEEAGKITRYEYKEGTTLLTAEYTFNDTQQINRMFCFYNDLGVCIETIVDNGTGKDSNDLTDVTMRRVTRTKVQENGTIAVGVPLAEEEFFLDETGNLQPLQKCVNEYDSKGRLTKKSVFGSDDKMSHTCSWVYDNAGRLVKISDLSGTITYVYDANNNRVEEHFVNQGLRHYNTYDRLNHLIQRREVDKYYKERIWRYRYNIHGQCIEEIDPLDHVITHSFDDLGREIETTYPSSLTPEGKYIPSKVRQAYDLCDMQITSSDAAGYSDKMSYNMRGQITHHTFADGSCETSTYTLGGALKKTVSRLGLVTEYDTDFIGRSIAKREYDTQGQLLSATHYIYHGLLLHAMTHENGPTITYHYDGAGRLIQQDCDQERQISYTYDAMGRLHTKTEWVDSSSAKVTTSIYNALGSVIKTQVSDLQGNLFAEQSYAYDMHGNCTEVCQKIEKGVAITKTRYDAWNRIIETIDPEGNKTHFTYSTDTLQGHKVLRVTRCDAKGRLHITIHHPNGLVAEERDVDSLGTLLKSHKLFYDAKGQVIQRQEAVYINGTHIKDVITKWVYNKSGSVIRLVEAVGTPEERQTNTLYTPDGQPKHVRLPNQEVHEFAYNVKGEKTQYSDHRGSFSFVYNYDKMGNLIEVVDQVTGNKTKRVFDLRGRMQQEELGNGLILTYQHDLLGRTTYVGLPDGSSVTYTHDAAYLRSVTRCDPEGNTRYVHKYTQIDLTGNTLQEELAENCGVIEHSYTKRGLIQSIQHHAWSQSIPDHSYDPLGNLLKCTTCDPSGERTENYAYDGLNQLIQEEGFTHHEYLYDSLYNRQIQDGVQGQFNSLNQLLDRGECVYQYDKNGQTLSFEKGQERTDYTYDGLGRLISLQSSNHRTTYTYDPFHRRLTKTTWTLEGEEDRDRKWCEVSTERFLYLDQNEVGSVDGDGTILTLRLLGRGSGAEIGASVAIEIGDRVYVPLHNQSGSIAALLDEDGTIVEYARYSAFGKRFLFDAESQSIQESNVGNPWGYSAKRRDEESGWSFFGRRYYNPEEGRWMTPDPLGFADGPNLYAYVLNSPMTHFDLYGLETMRPLYEISQARARARATFRPGHNFAYATYSSPQPLSQFFSPIYPIAQLVGGAVETFFRHLVPVPGVRDMGMALGRLLSFRPIEGCEYCRETDSRIISIGKKKIGSTADRVMVNGICTSEWDFKQQMRQDSESLGGDRVIGVYNATRGLLLDLMRSIYMMMGGLPRITYLLADCWKYLYAQRTSENYTILHNCHSQGGQVTGTAGTLVDGQIRSKIEVKTYGSPELIPRGIFKDAHNYISTRDAVPFLGSPLRAAKAHMGMEGNVSVLPGSGYFGCDHLMFGSGSLSTYGKQRMQNNRHEQVRFQPE